MNIDIENINVPTEKKYTMIGFNIHTYLYHSKKSRNVVLSKSNVALKERDNDRN